VQPLRHHPGVVVADWGLYTVGAQPMQLACQVIPQSLSIMLSIRELIRQGYLFGAHVLVRALVERAAILLYLHLYPEEIERWNRGWHLDDIRLSAKKVTDAGGKVLGEPMEIPGVGQYVSFTDTEGNRGSMLQPLPRNWHAPASK